ncbi:MAG TPA: hypothetical protein VK540_13900 [Polyangiaceae bacterium]|nr:hypothetical protein [Polyangiaceae bacterium]
MKRSLGALGLLFFGALASGCPVYSNNVLPAECIYATDCPTGYRCAAGGVCVLSPPHGGTGGGGGSSDAGTDGAGLDGARDAGPGDASREGSTGDASREGGADAPSSGDAGPVVFCGNPNDCTSAETCSTDGICHPGNCTANPCINQYQCEITPNGPACVRGDSQGCGADHQCFANERCIDGACIALTDLCSDRAQCGAGKACADGRCVATCTADGQCAPGFLCRTALGICGAKAEACLHTNDCGSRDQVCVDGACVPRCGVAGACGAGTGVGVCVDNGCVPSSKVIAECARQGTPTGCPAGGICLHRHCYVSCDQDAGGCSAQSSAPICKTVAAAGASYAVCGTTDTLGSECDPSGGKACTDAKICIDGYCR